ncbi:MAG: DinB family protein [Candidatus Thorarchaeota archaeon]
MSSGPVRSGAIPRRSLLAELTCILCNEVSFLLFWESEKTIFINYLTLVASMRIKRNTLLKKMKHLRKRWDSTIGSIIEKGLESEPISQKWYLKDVIAHITWYDRELLNALEAKSIVDSSFWNMDVEARNEMIFKNTQDRTIEELLQESKEIFEGLLKAIELIGEDDLNSEVYIKRKEGTRVTHDFIGGITFWHYEEHEDILVDLFDLDYM